MKYDTNITDDQYISKNTLRKILLAYIGKKQQKNKNLSHK